MHQTRFPVLAFAGLLAAALLGGCAASGVTRSTQGSLVDGVYTSPDGSFRVKVPRLLQPGADIRDEVDAQGNLGVRFMDDLCRFFGIQAMRDPLPLGTGLEEAVTANELPRLEAAGATLHERGTQATPYGEAVRLRYLHPGGAPCQRLEIDSQGRRLVNPDAEVDLVVLAVDGRVFRFLHVRNPRTAMAVQGFTGSGDEAFAAMLRSFTLAGR